MGYRDILTLGAMLASVENDNYFLLKQNSKKRVQSSSKRKWIGPYGIIVEALNVKQAVILIKKEIVKLNLPKRTIKPKLYNP